MRVYVAGDTGPSGFGEATRGIMRELVPHPNIDVNFRTHQWGWNEMGEVIQSGDMIFPDSRFEEWAKREGWVNPDYLLDDVREISRRSGDLIERLNTSDSEDLMFKQWDGEPEDADIWYAHGGVNFAEQAPDGPYSILHTDYNLDIVPRRWQYYIDKVDEVWVPSEWTLNAILKRYGQSNEELTTELRSMPYGINQRYKPGKYDHELCPQQHQSRNPERQHCLDDDKFTFLVISRFYHIKGLYRTIKAFIEEFRGKEPVRLMIKTTSNNQFNFNPREAAQAVVDELGYPDVPEIGLRVNPLDHQHMYDLLGHVDCFVQASRAECFGIAQLEAAYCGTPVIVTNWSSQREVCGDKGFFKLNDYTLEQPRQESNALMYEGGDSYPPDSKWAVNDIDEIGKEMRYVYEMSERKREKMGEHARRHVVDNYQWSDRVKPRIERLEEVA